MLPILIPPNDHPLTKLQIRIHPQLSHRCLEAKPSQRRRLTGQQPKPHPPTTRQPPPHRPPPSRRKPQPTPLLHQHFSPTYNNNPPLNPHNNRPHHPYPLHRPLPANPNPNPNNHPSPLPNLLLPHHLRHRHPNKLHLPLHLLLRRLRPHALLRQPRQHQPARAALPIGRDGVRSRAAVCGRSAEHGRRVLEFRFALAGGQRVGVHDVFREECQGGVLGCGGGGGRGGVWVFGRMRGGGCLG